ADERRSRAAVSALQALAPFSYSTLDFRYYSHLITRSALTSTFGEIVRPICLAALRLIISSNLVGCSTGRSAGLAPFKILSTYVAARRSKSAHVTAEDLRPPASTISDLQYVAGSRLFTARSANCVR